MAPAGRGSGVPDTPDEDPVDSAWDFELDPPITSAPPAPPPPPPRSEPEGNGDDRATLPPPLPSQEYVDVMMATVRDSVPDFGFGRGSEPPMTVRGRQPLATLLEIDPLQYDFAEQPLAVDRASAAPDVQVDEEEVEVDVDVDLVNTMPPPSGVVDEMDMLPFEEVLASITERTSVAPAPPPPPRGRTAPAGLRLGATGPASPPRELPRFEEQAARAQRATPPGGVDTRALAALGEAHAKLAKRVEARDFAGALMLAETLVAADAGDHAARACAERCRGIVVDTYVSRLGDRRSIPHVVVDQPELKMMSLDHRAGFMLSCVDGVSSLDEILDMSGMPELDTVRLLWELVQEGVLQIDPPASGRVPLSSRR